MSYVTDVIKYSAFRYSVSFTNQKEINRNFKNERKSRQFIYGEIFTYNEENLLKESHILYQLNY